MARSASPAVRAATAVAALAVGVADLVATLHGASSSDTGHAARFADALRAQPGITSVESVDTASSDRVYDVDDGAVRVTVHGDGSGASVEWANDPASPSSTIDDGLAGLGDADGLDGLGTPTDADYDASIEAAAREAGLDPGMHFSLDDLDDEDLFAPTP